MYSRELSEEPNDCLELGIYHGVDHLRITDEDIPEEHEQEVEVTSS